MEPPSDDESKESVDGDSVSSRGRLSMRMQKEGNLWREIWETAKPVPAVKQSPLYDEDLTVTYPECSGYLGVKNSWPGAFRTLYGDHERYETTYFSAFLGYCFSGDGCSRFVISDELDYLVLHDLFMLTTLPLLKVILTGIANAIDLADRFLPKLQSLNCKPMVVSFRDYSMDQIIMILKQRLMALLYTVFQPQALELCARDSRGAIEMFETELRENICTSNLSSILFSLFGS